MAEWKQKVGEDKADSIRDQAANRGTIIDTYDERTRLWMKRLNKPKTKRQKQRSKLKNIRHVLLETAYEMAKFNSIDGVQLSPEQRARYEDAILRLYINNLDKLKKLGNERMVNYYEVE